MATRRRIHRVSEDVASPPRARTPTRSRGKGKGETKPWKDAVLAALVLALGLLLGAALEAKSLLQLPKPLPNDASEVLFAEGRAMEHVRVLADRIGTRVVGTKGYQDAITYLLDQAKELEQIGGDDFHVEVDLQVSSGSFPLKFLNKWITNTYANITNVVVKIAPKEGTPKPGSGVLVSSHFDTTVGGTPGASDCAACVSVVLEAGRAYIASGRPMPFPVVLLLNGAEEPFLIGAHAFLLHHRWAKDVSKVINVESTGSHGPDLVYQSAGEDIPTALKRSPYPTFSVVAQDLFTLGIIPQDSDFRIYSQSNWTEHTGRKKLYGLDMAILLDSYVYHTQSDRIERIKPGTVQRMGENVLFLMKEFAKTDILDTRSYQTGTYFEIRRKLGVSYSKKQAMVLHSAPLALAVMLIGWHINKFGGAIAVLRSILRHITSFILSALLPGALGLSCAYISRQPMQWYSQPVVAVIAFVPAGFAGVMLPHCRWNEGVNNFEAARASACSALFTGLISFGLTTSGGNSAYLFAASSLSSSCAAVYLLSQTKKFSRVRLTVTVMFFHFIPCLLAYPVSVAGFLIVVEKVGFAASVPGNVGITLADFVLGAITGVLVFLVTGGFASVYALATRGKKGATCMLCGSTLFALVFMLALSQNPYTNTYPKRVWVGHLHEADSTPPSGKVLDYKASWAFGGMDSTPVEALDPVAQAIKGQNIVSPVPLETFEAVYPANLVWRDSLLATGAPLSGNMPPVLKLQSASRNKNGTKHLSFQLQYGTPMWIALKIQGELHSWSLGSTLPTEADCHTCVPYYLVRHVGLNGPWDFVLETDDLEGKLRIDLSSVSSEPTPMVKALTHNWPDWIAVMGGELFKSTWIY